jgi:2-polyprenyl-6-methoxyphenol hydroxylase-like FAD-dependent oxidoreductase
VLARTLKGVWASGAHEVERALQQYEQTRKRRCWPLTVRSRIIGAGLQSTLPPVVALRDAVAKWALRPSTLLGHTFFDVGKL